MQEQPAYNPTSTEDQMDPTHFHGSFLSQGSFLDPIERMNHVQKVLQDVQDGAVSTAEAGVPESLAFKLQDYDNKDKSNTERLDSSYTGSRAEPLSQREVRSTGETIENILRGKARCGCESIVWKNHGPAIMSPDVKERHDVKPVEKKATKDADAPGEKA